MKKIMILSSNYTGHGHASIAQSLTEQLDKYEDVRYEVVDGFDLIGKMGIRMSKFYGPITRNAKELWKLSYAVFDQHPSALLEPMTVAIHDRFIKALSQFMPDLILTVHPFFNGSIMDILEFYDLDIPVYALQADIVNIHGAWCDARAKLTLCPTQEAYDFSLQRGMPPEKLQICGFPTRAQFCDAAREADTPEYDGKRPLNCLLMSGGEGSGNMLKYALQLLKYVNCNLEVICGRNEKLQKTLIKALAAFGERVHVYGFLDDVHLHMLKSDLVIARGSPNTLMEAVVLGVPLVITGSLPGQEADNPALMVSHNLGVVCENPSTIPFIVNALMANDGARLKEIRLAQRAYRNLDNARNIAALVRDAAISSVKPMPQKRMMLLSRKNRHAVKRTWRKVLSSLEE
ncbi:MAG: glycosyltransferase [Clostridia bacterium]